MRFLGAKVVLTPGRRARHRHAQEGRGAGREERLVPHPPVRPTRPTPTSTPSTTAREILDDFADEPLDYWVTGFGTGGTLKGVARVLRKETPEDEDHRLRTRRRADAHQRHSRSRATPTATPPAAIPRGSRTRCRAGARTSSPSSTGDALAASMIDQVVTVENAEAHAVQQGARPQGGHLRRHHLRRHLRRRPEGRRRSAEGLDHPLHAARHRRALPQHAALRRHRRRHERGGDRHLEVDAERAASAALPRA